MSGTGCRMTVQKVDVPNICQLRSRQTLQQCSTEQIKGKESPPLGRRIAQHGVHCVSPHATVNTYLKSCSNELLSQRCHDECGAKQKHCWLSLTSFNNKMFIFFFFFLKQQSERRLLEFLTDWSLNFMLTKSLVFCSSITMNTIFL